MLVDIKEGLPQGKALDINQAAAVLGYEANVTGSNGYDESAGSEVVVITAGLPRQPGMSRDDLVTTNEKIVKSVTEQVIAASPDAILVIVSNPLDAMCHVAKNVSGWPKERVFGMAGILDTARFSAFIAWETGMSIKDVTAMVLGGHGDQMVPVVSATTVGGIPLRKLAPEDRIQAMVERTAKGGGELVNLLGTSAWYAPGAAAAQMVDAVVLDEKRVLPCTAYLEGEYGIDGLYMGVPVVLGAGGIERIVELDLDDAEQQALKASADAVREVVGVLTTQPRWNWTSAGVRQSSAARPPGSGWAARSRSPRRARTSSCSPAARTSSSARRSASAASPSQATSRARTTSSGSSRPRSSASAASTSSCSTPAARRGPRRSTPPTSRSRTPRGCSCSRRSGSSASAARTSRRAATGA